MVGEPNPRSINIRWHLPAVMMITILLVAVGCAKRESRQETRTNDSMALQSGSERVEGQGPATSELPAAPVGGSDSLLNAVAAKITPWVQMWRQADGEFSPNALFRVGVRPAIRGGHVQPIKNVYPPSPEKQPVFLILSAQSPDRRYNLIFDWYRTITETDGKTRISGEPDHAPLLLDLAGSTANQFETCGPSCGFDWGVWISPSSFVLAGWQEKDGTTRGRLNIYSLADSTATRYVTPPVSPVAFARYRAAWEASVVKKYTPMKTATPRS